MQLNFRRGSAYANKKAREWLKSKSPKDINSVTVIRHAAIGDFMNIRPFLIGIREYFPNAKITLSVDSNATYGIPYDLIDTLHYMDKHHPKNKKKKTGLLYRIAQARKLPKQDIIFDLTDSSLTLLLIFFSKASIKVGYPYRLIRRQFFDMYVYRSDFVAEVENILHMLNFFGYKKHFPLRYGYEKQYPKSLEKRVVYFPGASTQDKCWEKEKFQDLIAQMSQTFPDYSHHILQGIKEDEKFLEIYEPLKKLENVKLQQAMSLENVMQYLANSACVVSNDTGIRNMAIAVETPTVGIFFATGPFRYWPKDRKHLCVFNEEYESPTIQEVFVALKEHIGKLYES